MEAGEVLSPGETSHQNVNKAANSPKSTASSTQGSLDEQLSQLSISKQECTGGDTPVGIKKVNKQKMKKKKTDDDDLPALVTFLIEDLDYLRSNHEIISKVLDDMYHSNKLDEEGKQIREAIRSALELIFKITISDLCQVILYGSSISGFGTNQSDLDMCLFVNNQINITWDQIHKSLMLPGIIVDEVLTQNILVPLIRFRFQFNNQLYKCDLTLDNNLACFNSRLLSTYCNLDQRVSQLGYLVKHMSKVNGIHGAHEGYLSSYAFTLMVIHFLQSINILPALQSLPPIGFTPGLGYHHYHYLPVTVCEHWNVYFFQDVEFLPKRDPEITISNLFYHFLDYYSKFDYNQHVIQIRTKVPMKKPRHFKKGHHINIQDPFILDRILGPNLSRQNTLKILTVIRNARNRFGKLIFDKSLDPDISDVMKLVADTIDTHKDQIMSHED